MPQFVKSHGLGNDYIVMEAETTPVELTEPRIQLICHRNFGVGSDGILLKVPSQRADFGVRILNPDGSEAEKSGNGVRIYAKYLYDHDYTRSDTFTIDTLGGIVSIRLNLVGDRIETITANMGRATFDGFDHLELDGQRIDCTSLSVGNPHCVIVVPDLSAVELERLGPRIESHPAFPNRTNVQFAQVLSRDRISILIWERGAGVT
ncbi:MAG: diaminopimelate epimerase, partial [Chloroflexi bacterium]|nr:diaminopimelate epimerase [Chloroflexota bacterium]